MKTNREKNTKHDIRTQEQIRPKQPEYQYKELEAIIHQWIAKNEQT